MMKPDYPNLELLEYMAAQFIVDDFMTDVHTPAERDAFRSYFSFSLEVFTQCWGSTCGGLDLTDDGSPASGRSDRITMYTTVIHEWYNDSYVVFFGNRLGYSVPFPNCTFYNDLYSHNMASLSQSKKRYRL